MAAYRRSALCPSKRDGAWRKATPPVAPAVPEDMAGALENAAAQLDDDPDVVALLLEGVMYQIVGAWYVRHGLGVPLRQHLLADLERRRAPLAWRVRLALRAPDVRARLVQARALLRALGEDDTTDSGPAVNRRSPPLVDHADACISRR